MSDFNSFIGGFGAGQQQRLMKRQADYDLEQAKKQGILIDEAGAYGAAGDYQNAQMSAGLAGNKDLMEMFSTLDENQRAQAKEQNQKLSAVAQAIMGMPAEQQAAAIQAYGSDFGFSEEQIAQAAAAPDLMLPMLVAQSRDLEKMIEQSTPKISWQGDQAFAERTGPNGQASIELLGARDATFAEETTRQNNEATLDLDRDKLSETTRSNKASEANTAFANQTGRYNARTNAYNADTNRMNADTARTTAEAKAEEDEKKRTPEYVKHVDAARDMAEVMRLLKTYRGLVERHGPRGRFSSEEKAELDTAHRALQLTMKSDALLRLGVLAGPDLDLLDDMAPGATGWGLVGPRKQPIMASLDQLEDYLKQKSSLIDPDARQEISSLVDAQEQPTVFNGRMAMNAAETVQAKRQQLDEIDSYLEALIAEDQAQ